MPPGIDAAADPQLQRLDGADPPARAVRRGPVRAEPCPTSASTWCARRWSPCRARRSRFRSAASSARCRSTSTPPALQARGLSGQDVANALAAQNLITPVGTQKIGGFEYTIQLNNAPSEIEELGDLPIKAVNGAMVYMRDVAQRARRQPAADQHRARRRQPLGADVGAEERRRPRRWPSSTASSRSWPRSRPRCPTRSRSAPSATSRCSCAPPSTAWRSKA